MNTSNFSFSEEAFLLNSLHEVVKVWARGNGKADFNLKIENGSAELQLAFSLGRPDDVHVAPPQHYHTLPHHDLHQEQHPPRPHRRHKGPARREKDRVRAEKHQAGIKSKKSAESADIFLPFSGRILPFNQDQTKATSSVAPPSSTSSPAPTRPTSAASARTPNGAESAQYQTSVTKPKKPTTSSPKYIDYNLVRKNLFPLQPPPPTHEPPGQEDPRSRPDASKEFQRKEDNLWARIFSTS